MQTRSQLVTELPKPLCDEYVLKCMENPMLLFVKELKIEN